jgi:hypothetical protein
MSSTNPLPDVGPPVGLKQDGTLPGDTYAAGTWQIVNGVSVLVPPFSPPSGFEVK